jgi:hypothetical protein
MVDAPTDTVCTIALDSESTRFMVSHVAYDVMRRLAEDLHNIGYPELSGDNAELFDNGWYLSSMIGLWGECATTAQDPEAETVDVPLSADLLRREVAGFIQAVAENDLHDALGSDPWKGDFSAARAVLDLMASAKAYLATLPEAVPA